jgi:hypothetical protein
MFLFNCAQYNKNHHPNYSDDKDLRMFKKISYFVHRDLIEERINYSKKSIDEQKDIKSVSDS